MAGLKLLWVLGSLMLLKAEEAEQRLNAGEPT